MYKQNNNRRRNYSGPHRNNRNGQGFRRLQGRHQRKMPDYNPMMFVNKASEEVVETYTPQHSFDEFKLAPQVMTNIRQKGYTQPTPIQDQVIPVILEGNDVVGIANTGTGKTAAFLIPIITKLLQNRDQKALIITPTRELAVQVEQEFRELARNTSLHSVICIGGVGLGGQIQRLSRRPQVVVGTPGRLKDLEQQRKLNFGWFQTIILDEVDRMLDMGFIHDVSYIVNQLPQRRLSLFFSATLPDSVQRVMKDFTHNPITVSVKTRPTSANVDQDIVKIAGRDKIEVLDELLMSRDFEKVLVFGRTKHGIDKIQHSLEKRGIMAAAIHGNKSQGQRQRALEQFKHGRVQVLLATDIASRGLDISGVTHVINYDLPETYEDYVHRIGRTGRANKKGKALTFID